MISSWILYDFFRPLFVQFGCGRAEGHVAGIRKVGSARDRATGGSRTGDGIAAEYRRDLHLGGVYARGFTAGRKTGCQFGSEDHPAGAAGGAVPAAARESAGAAGLERAAVSRDRR